VAQLKLQHVRPETARERQDPLRECYQYSPEDAKITDRARTTGGVATDPFHGTIIPGSGGYGLSLNFGIHRAMGGDNDAPNPGDLLCAALAACLDSSIRVIAERLEVTLESLEVKVEADLDVRGTLQVDPTVPVGFQAMRCEVNLEPAEGSDPESVEKLFDAAEHSCVNLATLRNGVPVETTLNIC
jgi:uncharacterized OsmC-like protein